MFTPKSCSRLPSTAESIHQCVTNGDILTACENGISAVGRVATDVRVYDDSDTELRQCLALTFAHL